MKLGWLDSDALSPAEVLHLYHRGAITREEYERAVEWAGEPPSPGQWKSVLRVLFLFFGVLLIVSGIIMFGAFNWESLPRLAKLGILQLLIGAFWLVSRLRPQDSVESTAMLWGACLLVGAHMAVFGQAYQTGADSYTLFLAWSALIVPWCLAARANLVWVTQAVLLNVAFSLFWYQRVNDDFALFALAFAAFNAALATVWHQAQKRHTWMTEGLTNVLLTAALGPLTAAGCVAPWGEDFYPACFVAAVAVIGFLFKTQPDDFPKMAAIASSGFALCIAVLSRVLIELETLGLLLIAVAIVALLAPMVRWLKAVHARQTESRPALSDSNAPSTTNKTPAPTPLEILQSQSLLDVRLEERAPIEPEPPYYLGCLTAMGAWIASLFLLGFVVAIALSDDSALTIFGFLLWGGAIFGRRQEISDFLNHLCFAMHLAGGCMVAGGLADKFSMHSDTGLLTVTFLLLTGSLIGFRDTSARGLFSFGLVITGGLLCHDTAGGTGLSTWLVLVAAVLTFALSAQKSWLKGPWRGLYRPVLFGGTSAMLVMIGVHSFVPRWVWGREDLPSWLLVTGLAVLTIYASYRSRAPIPALLGVLVLNAFTASVPGVAAAVLVFILAFQAKNRDLFGQALAAVLVFGIQYYYNLEMSFLLKSSVLIASGVVLLVTRRMLRANEEADHAP